MQLFSYNQAFRVPRSIFILLMIYIFFDMPPLQITNMSEEQSRVSGRKLEHVDWFCDYKGFILIRMIVQNFIIY